MASFASACAISLLSAISKWKTTPLAARMVGRRALGVRAELEGDVEDDFEARLAKLQRKSKSGSGKKAEIRKARKEGQDPNVPTKESIFLAPVAIEEPISDGMVVDLGFKPYTERLHGRLACLGLAAILLVELASGESLLKYHDSSTITTQLYVVLFAAAVFVKFEKEKKSVWPME